MAMKGPDTVARPESGRSDIFEVARQKLGPFLTLFGSTAAVAAFLIFAGFLSEFAVYRFSGLPRLSFNLTALIESGAEVVIDTLSLTVSSWARGLSLVLAFIAVLTIWSLRDSVGWLNRMARAPVVFYLFRLSALVLAAALLLGQIGLAQQGLQRSELEDQQRVQAAVDRAYADWVPSPRERMRQLEHLTYEIQYFPILNWLADLLDAGEGFLVSRAARSLRPPPPQNRTCGTIASGSR